MTVIATDHDRRRVTVSHRVPMTRVTQGELRKMFNTRSGFWLIASIGVHLVLLGLGLVFFGPEGYRAPGFSDARYALGSAAVPGQAVWIVGSTLALIAALYLFFGHTLSGKALRATAVNRLGARLVGIATALSGRIAFLLAGLIGLYGLVPTIAALVVVLLGVALQISSLPPTDRAAD